MMKLFCIGILCFSAFAACGQPGPAGKQYLGTKTPYPVTRIIRNTPAPKGYQAVFINYVGRHGARFLTKPGSDVLVVNVLALADSNNALTATGRNIKQMARRFEEIEKGNYEN
ncbi:MAG TPA: hypothetical protein VHB48_16065, partial [Chitinophagaceae bacterium]|nr:hypothetical protein [Chitinophagaceae bacterium]